MAQRGRFGTWRAKSERDSGGAQNIVVVLSSGVMDNRHIVTYGRAQHALHLDDVAMS